jgi:multidrug efflux pump subunit AcrB
MARRFIPLLVIASFALLVFAFAGCGGDDDSSASDDTTLTETTTTEETSAEETTEETTEAEDTDTTETTETSASDDFATSENCQEFAQIGSEISGALTGSTDPDQIKAAFDDLAAAAPEEIKADFETLADYMSEVADALGGVDLSSGQTPDPSALAKLQSLDATAATAAGQNISKWVTENCTGVTP